jgi:MoxR-like ATPase
MMRISIGYPPPHVETRLILEPDVDRVQNVRPVLTTSELSHWQREVDTVRLDAALAKYLQAVIAATRSTPSLTLGASPLGARNLAQAARACAILRGRNYCIADDIHDLAVALLAHRVRLAAHNEGYMPTRDEAESVIRDVVARVPVPL